MTVPELASRLEDILEAIAAIAEYTAGKSFEDYHAERMLRDAVERNIERISEASRHIPDHLKASHPEIAWPKVAGIGNVLRHAYPIVDDGVVWEVVARDLPPPRGRHRGHAARGRSGPARPRLIHLPRRVRVSKARWGEEPAIPRASGSFGFRRRSGSFGSARRFPRRTRGSMRARNSTPFPPL